MPKRKTHNQFIKEIKEKFGDEYTVLSQYEKASKKVNVRHNKCNKEYYVRASAFLSGARCTYCFKPVKKSTEQFKKEVSNIVGDEYSVIGEYKNNKEKVKMLHNNCGNEYEVTPGHFLSTGRRCPYCKGGSPQSKNVFAEKFNKVSKNNFELISEYTKSKENINVRHVKCGYEYSVRADNFLSGKGCPKCKESYGEKRISDILKNNSIPFITQKRFDNCRNVKPLPFDFAIIEGDNVKLLIEYNGEQHYKPVELFGGKQEFNKRKNNDKIKFDYCVDNNIELVYISYNDNIDECMDDIIYKLSQS